MNLKKRIKQTVKLLFEIKTQMLYIEYVKVYVYEGGNNTLVIIN